MSRLRRALGILKTILLYTVAIAIVGGTIAGIEYGLYRLGGVMLAIVGGVSLLAGMTAIPAVVYLLGDSMWGRSIIAKILHTTGAIARGRTVLVQVGSEYRERAADAIRDEHTGEVTAWTFDAHGETKTISDGLEHVIRFGKRPLAMYPVPASETFGKWTAGVGEELRADGGDEAEGFTVDMKAYIRRMGGAAGPALSARAEEEAKAKYGGTGQIGTKWMVIGLIAMALIGGGLGYVMVA